MTAAVEMVCRACGLCCDGTLFTLVRLTPADAARVRARGLPVLPSEDGDILRQRCEALDGRDCRIYTDRPSQCAAFQCALLHAVRDGEATAAEAIAIVEDARRLTSTSDARAFELLRRWFAGR